MICPNCKQEILDGSVYCEHCGHTIQIVPDYNALDDVLPSILEENPKAAEKDTNQKTKEYGAKKTKQPKSKKKWLAFALFGAILFIVVIWMIWFNYRHSYAYYMDRGQALDSEKEYSEANKYYLLAKEESPTVEVYVNLGRNAYRLGDYDAAKDYLLKAIELDDTNTQAFELLCKIYENEKDFMALEDLATRSKDPNVLAIVDASLIFPPSFSVDGGSYDDDVFLHLSAPKDYKIYYTLDGSDPDDGVLYDEESGILLTDGTTKVRAVCQNSAGKFGFDAEKVYKITYQAPEYPTVNPSNGSFYEETYITIVPNDPEDRIYYTWDGSTPTAESELYTEPIAVPEGNNILSVIAINQHELISEVLQCNFVYRP